MGSSIWNKLSNDLKILTSTSSFTHNYKKLVTTYTVIIIIISIIIIINTIIITIKWIVGTKCFVNVRYKTGFNIKTGFNVMRFFSSDPKFFEYICSNRLE